MRTIFGVSSLLVALVIVAVAAKKQIGTLFVAPASSTASTPAGVTRAQQFKQTVDGTLQQTRPMPDDK